jgi:hypothetical protein
VADLPQRVRNTVTAWPSGAYEHVAEMFRNHWRAESRAVGSKRDWPATWENWLMRENTTILRQVKAGVSFTAGVVAPPKTAEQAEIDRQALATVTALRTAEGAGAARLRAGLRTRMGASVYDHWMANTSMAVDGDTLVVTVATDFVRDWSREHFTDQVSKAAGTVLGRKMTVDFRTVKPPD